MSTFIFACGCIVSRSMYGEHAVMAVRHCADHRHLFSEDKTLRQMAEELWALHGTVAKESPR